MNPEPTWGSVFKDKAMIISLVIMFQFFALIIIFSQFKSQMQTEAKGIILQTYVIAFSLAYGYFIGSSSSSKDKDKTIADIKEAKP